ncbi:MAG TPA: aminotransferase class I/II-fold pyridoxal phosphate-dependent enzyme [Candidatus Dormibacteraeota bacterium]|nr:aminotransferase class I/II-fold pyridoxal phosphate-dependent enzyme [Candidatus Dormibacteraeota bacterium]
MRPDSRAVHAGRELKARDPLAPPIVQAAVHVYDDLDDYDAVAGGRRPGHVYARYSNDNTDMLASAVAELECAEAGIAAASGMAAIFTALLSFAPRPAPIAVTSDAYGVTMALLRDELVPLGYEVRQVDTADLDSLDRALRGAAVLHCETITNPLCRVSDLEAVCRVAGGWGVPVLVDNTFATPVLCRPLELGAAAVMHSATKYLGGHSDLLAGVLVGSRELIARARQHLAHTGAALGPFEAWLALRGLRTLHLRMRRHSDNAIRIARCLAGLAGVEAVHHPLLAGSPYEAVARRLLPEGAGGMLAFDLAGGRPAVQEMVSRFRLVRFAASLAGVETTISYPAITSHRDLTPEERLARGVTPGTVRVSAGLEDPADLTEDFERSIASPRP